MATLNTFILLTATFTPATVKRKRIVAHSNSVTLYVHCLPCSSGKHLFQISAKPKYTAHTDQLYFGYESVNHDIQMKNLLHFVTVFIVSSTNDQVPYGHVAFRPVMWIPH